MARATTKKTPATAPCDVLRTAIGDTFVTLMLDPVPAARPRVGRWGAYYPPTYKAWKAIAEASVPESTDSPVEGPVCAHIEIVGRKPKSTKRFAPVGDFDNHAKGICDVLTKRGYWLDDDQIVFAQVTKRYATPAEPPHVGVRFWKQPNE